MQTAAVDSQEAQGVSNAEFARRVGCHLSMASRLRNGHRMPSSSMLTRIIRAFDIEGEHLEFLMSVADNPEAFGAFLRSRVFRDAE